MAAAPKYKVFSPAGEYVASCKYVSDAAAIVACYGEGSTIRRGHTKKSILYIEPDFNHAEDGAFNSFDYVAECVFAEEDRRDAR